MRYAGIVLYNPQLERLKQNISSIINQVDKVILIDNGSKNINLIKKEFECIKKIELISNSYNLGVARALNQIIEWGIINRYKWCLTLDQDSICPEGIIEEYEKFININDKIAILCPVIYDINLKSTFKNYEKTEFINDSQEVITSGCYINLEICKDLGFFDEKLFIDFVDIEYNERVLRNGYKIMRVNSIKILHEVGHMRMYKFGEIKIKCSNHSAFRRYYMVRNRLYFKRKYYGTVAFLKEWIRLLLGTIKIIIFENDRYNKLKATINGLKDYNKLLNK